MITTQIENFTPSVNIIRDIDKDIHYIPTPNSRLIFNEITSDYLLGIRAFSIIGAYGTGKSSFLWAFEKVVNAEKEYFPLNPSLRKLNGSITVNIIGRYSSIIEVFANEFGVSGDYTTTDIVKAIDKLYQKANDSNRALIIFIDEFGKFLEYAAKNTPEQELYFIQQLSEYVNDTNKNIFLLTTLHQDFNAYAFGLTKSQRDEWHKVKGRLKEIAFNEPVEQLLYLAAERLGATENKPTKNIQFGKLFRAIEDSRAFPLRDYLTVEIAEKLLPFDILAASILTLSLQRYGQNDRSLFSFIETNHHLGIKHFDQNVPYYNISHVYEYLISNFNVLHTKHNPDFTQWSALKIAIERVEGIFENQIFDVLSIVKTIGLLNIFSSASAVLDDSFIQEYGKYSLGIKNPSDILSQLEKHKIVRFVKHSQKYILFEGTDLDIELAIDQAGNLIEYGVNLVAYLNSYFDFPFILAKSYYFEFGTPRFFEFLLSETPIEKEPSDEIDGYINLVFSEEEYANEIIEVSKNSENAIIYGWYKNTHEIRNLIFEIQKVQKVIDNNKDDKVALRELNGILDHQVSLLNHYVLGAIYTDNDNIEWYFKGEKVSFSSQKEFNRILSHISEKIYPDTPKYKSELVNKTKLSTPILTAKKRLITTLIENWQEEALGFSDKKFPPEKTIYLSLLSKTGVLRQENGVIGFYEPLDSSFKALWKTSEEFLKSSKAGKRNLRELVDLLGKKPFKLKRGLIDIWMPVFLYAKRNDFALFESDVYVPYITDQVLEVLGKSPHKYYIKAFDVEGVNLSLFNGYRKMLQQKEIAPGALSFIETIRPFLTFYKSLPNYAKNTKNLSKQAINIRSAIVNAKNPEKTFFQDFPSALGYNTIELARDESILSKYIDTLQKSIKDIRTSFNELKERFEKKITAYLYLQESDFNEYRSILINRFTNLKTHKLKQHHKVFLQRINSDLDRDDWLNAISQACVGKSLENLNDADEPLLYERFIELLRELDNLCEITPDDNGDELLLVEITDNDSEVKKQVLRLPEAKKSFILKEIQKISSNLTNDKETNILILAKMLKELLNEKS